MHGKRMTQHSAPEPGSLSASLGGDDARAMALDLDALRALADKATPGPFRHRPGTQSMLEAAHWDHSFTAVAFSHIADVEYVAALLNAAPALIAEVKRLRDDRSALANALWNDEDSQYEAQRVALVAEVARLKSVVVEFESVRSSLPQNSPNENSPETWEWNSVCSTHREAVPDCSMCKAGTWVKNSEQALSEAFFAAAPEAWVAFMNREPTL